MEDLILVPGDNSPRRSCRPQPTEEQLQAWYSGIGPGPNLEDLRVAWQYDGRLQKQAQAWNAQVGRLFEKSFLNRCAAGFWYHKGIGENTIRDEAINVIQLFHRKRPGLKEKHWVRPRKSSHVVESRSKRSRRNSRRHSVSSPRYYNPHVNYTATAL